MQHDPASGWPADQLARPAGGGKQASPSGWRPLAAGMTAPNLRSHFGLRPAAAAAAAHWRRWSCASARGSPVCAAPAELAAPPAALPELAAPHWRLQ